LANRSLLVCYFRALWRSTISARVHESKKLKMVSQPAWHRILYSLSPVWNSGQKWVKYQDVSLHYDCNYHSVSLSVRRRISGAAVSIYRVVVSSSNKCVPRRPIVNSLCTSDTLVRITALQQQPDYSHVMLERPLVDSNRIMNKKARRPMINWSPCNR